MNFFCNTCSFYVLIFGQEVGRILPWMEPVFPHWEMNVITGPPGSPKIFFLISGFEQFDCNVLWYSFLIFLYLISPEFLGSLSYNFLFIKFGKFFNLYFFKYFPVLPPPSPQEFHLYSLDALLFVLFCFCYLFSLFFSACLILNSFSCYVFKITHLLSCSV